MSRFRSYARRHHVALLALFFSLGGTSFAAANVIVPRNSVGTQQVLNNSLLLRDFRKSQLRQLRGPRGLRGPQGVAGSQGNPGAQGPQGLQGAQGPAGTAVAYARIQADGSLEPGNDLAPGGQPGEQNKNVLPPNVQHAAVGTYCFGQLPFRVKNAVVTLDSAGAGANVDQVVSVAVQRGNNLIGCDADHQQARVSVYDVSAAALADARFSVWFE